MNTLSPQFNTQANWNLSIWPLYMLLILDDIEHKEKRRRARIAKVQRSFHESSVKQSREQYQRQVQAPHPQPQYRVTSPGF